MNDYMCANCGGGFRFSEIISIEDDTDVCIYCRGYDRIKLLVQNGEISNLYCDHTQHLIQPSEGMYILAGNHYSEKTDIDKLIEEVSDGKFKTKEAAYEDGDDWYYWTENYDEEEVISIILNEGEYVDKYGTVIKL